MVIIKLCSITCKVVLERRMFGWNYRWRKWWRNRRCLPIRCSTVMIHSLGIRRPTEVILQAAKNLCYAAFIPKSQRVVWGFCVAELKTLQRRLDLGLPSIFGSLFLQIRLHILHISIFRTCGCCGDQFTLVLCKVKLMVSLSLIKQKSI
jgi:hypothetical protein